MGGGSSNIPTSYPLFSASSVTAFIINYLLQKSHKFIYEVYFGIHAKDIPSPLSQN